MHETAVSEALDEVRSAVSALQEASCNGLEGLQEAKGRLNAALVAAKQCGAGEQELLEAGRGPTTIEVDGEAAGIDARKRRKMRQLEKEFLNKDRLEQDRLERERQDKERAARVAGRLAARRGGGKETGIAQEADALEQERLDKERAARVAERLAARRRGPGAPALAAPGPAEPGPAASQQQQGQEELSEPEEAAKESQPQRPLEEAQPQQPAEEGGRAARVAQALAARRAKAREEGEVEVLAMCLDADSADGAESGAGADAGAAVATPGKERRATERANRVAQALAARRARAKGESGGAAAGAAASIAEAGTSGSIFAAPESGSTAASSASTAPAEQSQQARDGSGRQASLYGGFSTRSESRAAGAPGRGRSRSRERDQEVPGAGRSGSGFASDRVLAKAESGEPASEPVQSLSSLLGRSSPPEGDSSPHSPGSGAAAAAPGGFSAQDVPIGVLMGTLGGGSMASAMNNMAGQRFGSSDLSTGGGETCFNFSVGRCSRWNCRFKHVRPGG